MTHSKPVFLIGLFIVLFTGVTNIGIIALDDYYFVTERIIPAQFTNLSSIVSNAFWSPLLPLILAGMGKVALALGIESPSNQLRFILFFVGLFTYSVHAILGPRHFYDQRKREITLFLMAFYFVCPLFFTRPMIESAASVFLMLSSYWACEYWKSQRDRSLCLSVIALSIASMIRFQAGICAVALFILVLLKRSRRTFATFVGMSLACFVITGWIDLAFSGTFHGTLKGYISYNIHSGTGHGSQPFYVFIGLFFLLSLPPAFLSRYRGFDWKGEYWSIFPTVLYFVVFVGFHSVIPHKEERFMVPVLPLFLVLLAPLANYLWFQRWRVIYFLSVNSLLLPLAVFSSPQNNVVGLMRYLDERPGITRLVGVGDTLVLFPSAYAAHEIKRVPETEVTGEPSCADAVAVRVDLNGNLAKMSWKLKKAEEFGPGFLESILVKLNPQRNFRRNTIEIYLPDGC